MSPASGLYALEGVTQRGKVQRGQVAYPRGHNQVWHNSVPLVPMLAKSVIGKLHLVLLPFTAQFLKHFSLVRAGVSDRTAGKEIALYLVYLGSIHGISSP